MKLKLLIEYDGLPFSGWQIQPGQLTVQAELERALGIYLGSLAKAQGQHLVDRHLVTGSGRTDAGVHAKGQVASFQWPDTLQFEEQRFIAAINGICHRGLSVKAAQLLPDTFDARFSPHSKCYTYCILLRRQQDPLRGAWSWRQGQHLDIPLMIAAAHSLRGTHDFAAFRAADCAAKTTTRTLLLSELARSNSDELVYTVHGTGFLKQMIRTIVGTLVSIGLQKRSIADLQTMLTHGNRTLAGQTAPAQGLCLEWVKYPEYD